MAFSEEILIRMGFDNSAVDRGLRSAQQKADVAAKGIASSFKMYLAGVGAAFTVGGLISGFNRLREFADNLSTKSAALGVSAEYMQRFAYAAEMAGISADKTEKAFAYMIARIRDAGQGLKEAQDAFMAVGVDPSGKPIDQVVNEIADAMRDMKDPTERAAVAMELFGAKNVDLVALLKQGSEEMQKTMESASVLTDSMIGDIDRADKAWKRIGIGAKVFFGGIVSDWLKGGDIVKKSGLLSQISSGLTLTLGRLVVGSAYRDAFGGGDADQAGVKLDQKLQALNQRKENERIKEENREKEKKKNLEEYGKLQKELADWEAKRAKEVTAEMQKRKQLLESFSNAVGALTRSKSDARNFSLQELANLNPDDLNAYQRAQQGKAQDVLWLEDEARFASLNNDPVYAAQLQKQALGIRSGITGLTSADRFPYGEQEKRAADALDKLLDYVDNGGMPVDLRMDE